MCVCECVWLFVSCVASGCEKILITSVNAPLCQNTKKELEVGFRRERKPIGKLSLQEISENAFMISNLMLTGERHPGTERNRVEVAGLFSRDGCVVQYL